MFRESLQKFVLNHTVNLKLIEKCFNIFSNGWLLSAQEGIVLRHVILIK